MMEMQPGSQVPKTDIEGLAAAIQEFEARLPGWWWSIDTCGVSRHASCGPDVTGKDAGLLDIHEFDDGFHADLTAADATAADALLRAMHDALEAKAKLPGWRRI